MLKRTGLLLVLIMFIFSASCWAAEAKSESIYKLAQPVADLYSDCVYLYRTSGISYKQFEDKFTEATIQKNRFLKKNKEVPVDLVDALNNVDMAFADAKQIWNLSFQYAWLSKSDYTISLYKKYPRMSVVRRQGMLGMYSTQEMANIVASYCIEYNEKLALVIDIEGK